MECREELDPEDIFSSSLGTLYDYQPITLASAGSEYTYVSQKDATLKVTLLTPDTLAANWFLHASDIWASSLYLADHLDDLELDNIVRRSTPDKRATVLELGAAAGLPGILIAKTRKDVDVIVSDYPDEQLMNTLSNNIIRNDVSDNCRSVPYAWGADPSPLLRQGPGFDLIIAADTLWNPDLHTLFIGTLRMTLKKSPCARVHLVAGLHTGRYTIESFILAAQKAEFVFERVREREVAGQREREWKVSDEGGEGEKEKRRWVVWMVLKWKICESTNGRRPRSPPSLISVL